MKDDIYFEEVHLNKNIDDLEKFYNTIYINEFPDINERESFDNLVYYLEQNNKLSKLNYYRYHIILVKDKSNSIIAGTIFDYFTEINSGVIEFIAVIDKLQSCGIGDILFDYIKDVLNKDSIQLSNKKLDYIFCEVDSPDISQKHIKKYLYFWKKHDYKHIDFKYIQPALSIDKDTVIGLWIIVYSNIHKDNTFIDGNIVIRFLYNYMKYCMNIEKPEYNKQFNEMKHTLENRNIHISEIIDK